MAELVRKKVRVEGVVQGVGFRPFVYSLASRFGLAGHVSNDACGVFAEIEGTPELVDYFLGSLGEQAPPLAIIERITVEPAVPVGDGHFRIVASTSGGTRQALVSADTATCADCLAELHDPADRRYGYPFVNCTHCGPRFSIVRDIPYDRPLTTMAGFVLCASCEGEYQDPDDRRFHAQPVCCAECGPALHLLDPAGNAYMGDPVATSATLLRHGGVLAVKGIGGYHLAVDARNEEAATTLRKRKHREDKPFAVMASDVEEVRTWCHVSVREKELLSSRRCPIVLLNLRTGAPIADSVTPGNRQLGVMLPYTPVHHLLLREVGGPIVFTSGNVSDEPIAYRDDDARRRLSGIADAFLGHDRAIQVRTDDSVVRSFREREMLVRRSRGYAPEPVTVPWEFPRPVLACGAELKNTFSVAQHRHVFVSHHIGDLENYETLRSFCEGITHFRRIFDVDPLVVAHDLHPEYLSTKYAAELDGVELIGVQHHHAHIASCLADNVDSGPVIGVAFDGLGYGTDGTLWGGEFLLADLHEFRRVAYFQPVPLPGGTTAIKQPWRMAVSYLLSCYGTAFPESLDVLRRNGKWADVVALVRNGCNTPVTSSAGRLFDAVAALVGARDVVNYEGQAAIELEQLADRDEQAAYPVTLDGRSTVCVAGADLIRAVVTDMLQGVDRSAIAARFHNGIARMVVDVCCRVREETGIATAALSGGVFQNMLLLERTVSGLESAGFRPLVHSRVPANDGGISLGQAVIAGHRLRRAA